MHISQWVCLAVVVYAGAITLSFDVVYKFEFQIGDYTANAQLDTASSDVWVNCTDFPEDIKGTDPFDITYIDNTFASGVYAHDTMTLDEYEVKNMQFAAVESTDTYNVFGLGFKWSESCVKWKYEHPRLVVDEDTSCVPYDNFLAQLKTSGQIETMAYSIILREDGGELIFDGVDVSQVAEHIVRLPVEYQPFRIYQNGDSIDYSEYTAPIVLVNHIRIGNRQIYAGAYPVMFDTGSTTSSFPVALMFELANVDQPVYFDMRGYEMEIQPENLKNSQVGFGEHIIVLGQDAFRDHCLMFDVENAEIGISRSAPRTLSSTPTIVEISQIPSNKAKNYYKQFKYSVPGPRAHTWLWWTWL